MARRGLHPACGLSVGKVFRAVGRASQLTSTYAIMSPSDQFLPTDKDNFLAAFKWATVDKMMFYNRQRLSFEWEWPWGMKVGAVLKTEEDEAAGRLYFNTLAHPVSDYAYRAEHEDLFPAKDQLHNGKLRTTELRLDLRFEPGHTYVNTKQRRIAINNDKPIFTLAHSFGLKGFLDGDYRYNYTEAGIYKRFWLGSWDKIDTHLKAGAQWNKVPYPLLAMPEANLSILIEDGMFNLINNMEFLNDRFATADVSWDLNGKIFNRIPFLRRLKWREYLGVKMLWGHLTDKNNPFLASNADDTRLMPFPKGSYVMDSKKPYVELIVGIHNIFKLIHVEYVHRVNYKNLPTCHENGIRYSMRMTF